MRFAVQVVLSIVLGFFLMGPLAGLFEAMHWPMFHGWALAHGSVLIAWPALTVASFVALGLIPWFRRDVRDDLAVGAAALVGAGILTTMDWPGKGGPRAPFYLLAIAFVASVALSALARRTWLVPVAMAVPLLLNDSIYLVLGGSFARDYALSEMTRTTIPIVINSLVGFVATVVIRRLTRTRAS